MASFIPQPTPIATNKLQQLVVIAVTSNPVRYKVRSALYKKFAEDMKNAGALMITVEQAFGERPFEVTEADNPFHFQVRSEDELWCKEDLVNGGIQYASQVFPDWKYIAWIDTDVSPMRPMREWLEETVQELQHHHVVQMWETAVDLGPDHQMIGEPATSFMSRYIRSGCQTPEKGGFWASDNDYYSKEHGHPGYAWAMTRFACDNMGGPIGGPLIDFAILGAGDRHMCLGWVGCMNQTFEHLNPQYRRALMQWQERSERWIKRDVGFVKGSIYHFFHGAKAGKNATRGYVDRWKILKDNEYDPVTDLTRDSFGRLKLETWDARQIRLRDQLRSYFRRRNEDDISLD